MKNIKPLTWGIAILITAFATNVNAESDYIPAYIQEGLVKICKNAALDKRFMMTKTIRSYKLKHKTVALNVVCNGKDIISFAEGYGAVKTTARLSNSIGSVRVTDLAAIRTHQYDVNFIMD